MLAGIAALRVGAGRLSLAVGDTAATGVAIAVPESGVVGLAETASGHVAGRSVERAGADLAGADAVLAGPGLDDADESVALLQRLSELVSDEATVVLDAFAIGVLPRVTDEYSKFGGRLVLTPNKDEAARLLDRELDDETADVAEIARRYGAVVSCYGVIADPDGVLWRVTAGRPGLGTSGSGDVLAGAITGLCARGATPAQAAVWSTHLHAIAGDRLAARIAPLGYLSRELLDELPLALREIEG